MNEHEHTGGVLGVGADAVPPGIMLQRGLWHDATVSILSEINHCKGACGTSYAGKVCRLCRQTNRIPHPPPPTLSTVHTTVRDLGHKRFNANVSRRSRDDLHTLMRNVTSSMRLGSPPSFGPPQIVSLNHMSPLPYADECVRG